MLPETKQRLITSLPLLLIGSGISGSCFIAGGACYEIPSWRLYFGIFFGGSVALFIGIIGIIGLIKKIPDWSTIWIGISIIGFMVLLNFVSSTGLPYEVAVLIFSILTALVIFYIIAKKSWHSAGLLGIGLSSALSLILFFIATNISHNVIKTGYYDFLFGLVMSGLIYLYVESKNRIRILILIFFVMINGLMLIIFTRSMYKINQKSQLLYLLLFSNGLLFGGIVFHYLIRLIKRMVKKQ